MRCFVDAFKRKNLPLHVLVNNGESGRPAGRGGGSGRLVPGQPRGRPRGRASESPTRPACVACGARGLSAAALTRYFVAMLWSRPARRTGDPPRAGRTHTHHLITEPWACSHRTCRRAESRPLTAAWPAFPPPRRRPRLVVGTSCPGRVVPPPPTLSPEPHRGHVCSPTCPPPAPLVLRGRQVNAQDSSRLGAVRIHGAYVCKMHADNRSGHGEAGRVPSQRECTKDVETQIRTVRGRGAGRQANGELRPLLPPTTTPRSVSETSASEAAGPGLQSPAEAAAEDRPPDVKLPAVRLAHGSCVAGSTTVTGHRSEARWPGARTQCRSLSVAPEDGPRTSPMQSVSDGRRFDRTSDKPGLQPGLAGAKPQGCVRGRCVRRAPRGLCPGRDPVLQPDKPSAQAAACALTHTHKCRRTQMHTNAHVSSVVCERAHTCTHLSSRYMHISMYTHVGCMPTNTHTCARASTWRDVDTHTYEPTHKCKHRNKSAKENTHRNMKTCGHANVDTCMRHALHTYAHATASTVNRYAYANMSAHALTNTSPFKYANAHSHAHAYA